MTENMPRGVARFGGSAVRRAAWVIMAYAGPLGRVQAWEGGAWAETRMLEIHRTGCPPTAVHACRLGGGGVHVPDGTTPQHCHIPLPSPICPCTRRPHLPTCTQLARCPGCRLPPALLLARGRALPAAAHGAGAGLRGAAGAAGGPRQGGAGEGGSARPARTGQVSGRRGRGN